jgi:hypothetical protein
MVGEIIGTGLTLDKNPKVTRVMKNRMIFEEMSESQVMANCNMDID